VAASVARRAVELGRDANVSLAEAAEHLVRLAKGRSSMLEEALAEVSRRRERHADLEYAGMLLRRALSDVARPPFFGESSTRTSGEMLDAGVN
jgi:hypothetical protein